MGTIFLIAGLCLTAAGLMVTGYFGWRNIRTTAAADSRAAAAARAAEITAARAEERRDCEADKQTLRDQLISEVRGLRAQLTEMTSDRDYWRGVYNALLEKRRGGDTE